MFRKNEPEQNAHGDEISAPDQVFP